MDAGVLQNNHRMICWVIVRKMKSGQDCCMNFDNNNALCYLLSDFIITENAMSVNSSFSSFEIYVLSQTPHWAVLERYRNHQHSNILLDKKMAQLKSEAKLAPR